MKVCFYFTFFSSPKQIFHSGDLLRFNIFTWNHSSQVSILVCPHQGNSDMWPNSQAAGIEISVWWLVTSGAPCIPVQPSSSSSSSCLSLLTLVPSPPGSRHSTASPRHHHCSSGRASTSLPGSDYRPFHTETPEKHVKKMSSVYQDTHILTGDNIKDSNYVRCTVKQWKTKPQMTSSSNCSCRRLCIS